MKIAIMQPYFLPYIGYFQLINAVEKFVVYDNIQFTKKGWINRNRILVNNKDQLISLPVKKASDSLNIDQRFISESFKKEKGKLSRRIQGAYKKAPYFGKVYPIVQEILDYGENNLFQFLHHSLKKLCLYLEIETEFIISSQLPIDDSTKAQEKVIAICKAVGGKQYINPIGGIELYSKEEFKKNNIQLNFLKAEYFEYPQYENEFIPWLSILDVMMFNPKIKVIEYINTKFTIL